MSFDKPWGNYLLEAIVETKAPETISFWPQTIAWQVIFIALIMMTVKKAYQAWKNYQANAYRREALTWLAQCSLAKEEHVRQLPALLRKTAMLANHRQVKESDKLNNRAYALKIQQDITELRGQSWVKWLDLHCHKTQFFREGVDVSSTAISCEKLLSQLAYMPEVDLNDANFNSGLKQLRQQIELWLKYHQLNITTKPQLSGENR